MSRRNRPQIYAEILEAIIEEARVTGGAEPARIHSKVYVPLERFKEYLAELKERRLVKENTLKVTKRGLVYLEEYKRVKEMLRRFGLE